MPTLTQLKYILAVDKLRHFAKASEECHVSQPSLSMQIQKVEEEVGFALFDRNKKPILPTPKGMRFIEQAKVVLRESLKLEDLSRRESDQMNGEYRLGMIPTLAPYILPLFVESFVEKYPKVVLKIDELKTESIVEQLRNDKLDGGILVTPLQERSIQERVLFYENFYVYCGIHSHFFSKSKVKTDELDNHDLWLLQDGHCFRNQVEKLCGSTNRNRSLNGNIFFEGGNLETLRHLIRNGKGFTLVPELFVQTLHRNERHSHVKEIEKPTPLREVSFVTRRDEWKGDISAALEEEILAKLPTEFRRSPDRRNSKIIPI